MNHKSNTVFKKRLLEVYDCADRTDMEVVISALAGIVEMLEDLLAANGYMYNEPGEDNE